MINPQLISFLKGIKANNSREWYEEHKGEYKELRQEFSEFIEQLAAGVAKFDEAVAKSITLGKPTTKVFRIHRDARFARGRAKYKTNISGYVSADVKSDSEPVYYFSLEPGQYSMIGGGLYMPERLVLSEVRDKIAENPQTLKKIESVTAFKKLFPNGLHRGRAVKTAPRGFSAEQEGIEYIRLQSFSVSKSLDDGVLLDKNLQSEILKSFKAIAPLNAFLRTQTKVLPPDFWTE